MVKILKTYLIADMEEIRDKLTKDLTHTQRESGLAAVVFAVPTKTFVRSEILPLIELWNYRSKDYVIFFFVGWQGDSTADDSGFSGKFLNKEDPGGSFHPRIFDQAIEQFENKGTWRYRGDTPLILCRAYLRYHKDTNAPRAFLDLSSVVAFQLEKAVREKSIESVEAFFELVIEVAKETPGERVHWKLSDTLGGRALGEAIIEALTAKLKGTKRILNAIKFFRVQENRSGNPTPKVDQKGDPDCSSNQ